jgi:titin
LEGRWLPSTFVVTTTDDAGPGSLRQAILDANATPGSNQIDFAIGDGGPQTIAPTSALPEVTNTVVLDGTTQPGFAGSPLIDLDGAAVTPGTSGLVIRADNSTVRGLAITGFRIENEDDPDFSTPGLVIAGSGDVVQGDYLGIDLTGSQSRGNAIGVLVSGSDNRIGGTTAEESNLISGNGNGVFITGSGNVVQGNDVGTDPTGTVPLGNVYGVAVSGSDNLVGGTAAEARNLISGNLLTGVSVGGRANVVQGNYLGTDVTGTRALGIHSGVSLDGLSIPGHIVLGGSILIGGTEPGAGNLISGNEGYGVQLWWADASDVIQGNRIGTDVTGTRALGNLDGVYLVATSNVLIGGTDPGAGNLIAGNRRDGIFISSTPTDAAIGNVVQGNLIGTDVSGTQPLGNARDGVHIDGSNGGQDNTVGGEQPGAGNTIAFNGNDGVLVDRSTGNALLGNAVFANGHQGIELLHGANLDQPAPVLTSATSDGSSTTVTGTLTSTPNSTFTIELFANSVNDPSGSGEQFLGSVVVTTDADGNASFTVTFDTAYPGMFLTATATDSIHNTSAFSAGIEVNG